MLKPGTVTCEARMTLPDGTSLPVALHAVPAEDDPSPLFDEPREWWVSSSRLMGVFFPDWVTIRVMDDVCWRCFVTIVDGDFWHLKIVGQPNHPHP
jgi:hypothetical protein